MNRIELSGPMFLAIAIGLAIVEAPVNKFLFDVALQTSNAVSYVISFALACFLLIAAHFAGKMTRQIWSDYKQNFSYSNVIVALVVMICLLGIVAILTIGRAEHSAASLRSGVGGIFDSFGVTVSRSGSIIGAFVAALGDVSALVLATVNLASVLATFLLGYFTHDPDKHYDKAFENKLKADHSIESADRRYTRARSRVIQKARVKLNSVATLYGNVNGTLVEAKTRGRIGLDEDDRFDLQSLDMLLKEERERTHPPAAHNTDSKPSFTGAVEGTTTSAIATLARPRTS